MSVFINTVDILGEEETFKRLAEGTITEYNDDRVASIGKSVFYHNILLKNVSFPNATSIGMSAFNECTALTTANIPNATSIGRWAFNGCSALTNASFPNVTSIGSEAFRDCKNAFININFPYLTKVEYQTFYGCKSATTIYLPNVTSIDQYGLKSCSGATTIDIRNVTSLGNYAFEVCGSLTTINIPNIKSMGNRVFASCYQLRSLIVGTNLTTVATIGTVPFYNCYHILGTTSSDYNPTGAKDGYIYVPASLVDDYREATNWAEYASQIMPYVATVAELSSIDGTKYDKAYVGENSTEYTYNGTWEVYTR